MASTDAEIAGCQAITYWPSYSDPAEYCHATPEPGSDYCAEHDYLEGN